MKSQCLMSLVLIAGALTVGCASRPREADSKFVQIQSPAPAQAPALALAFDPPITAFTPPLNLDRAERMPSAFVGYDSVTTTVYTRFDDSQRYNASVGYGRFYGAFNSTVDRQAVVETIGVRQR